jgi:hypothetical protein
MKISLLIFIVLVMSFVPQTDAGSITIKLPQGMVADKATATTEKLPQSSLNGKIKGNTITFADALPGSKYEVQITLKDGSVLQGVDMGWYSIVPDKPGAEALNDDDKQQMTDVLKKVLSFYNINDVVVIQGNHNRAVMLVQLVRDKAFHSDKGGDEVIWRPELWYFENHHGGWEKVQQTDRVLRRERYPSHDAYHAVIDHIRWTPELGGLRPTPKSPDVTVTLPADAGVAIPPPGGAPATTPAAKE